MLALGTNRARTCFAVALVLAPIISTTNNATAKLGEIAVDCLFHGNVEHMRPAYCCVRLLFLGMGARPATEIQAYTVNPIEIGLGEAINFEPVINKSQAGRPTTVKADRWGPKGASHDILVKRLC